MNSSIGKVLASIFIVYHLIAIIVFPNPYSILARYLQPVINDYGNLLGLNTTWQFFSPDPGQLRYLEYDVIVETKQDINFETYKWPPQDGSIFFSSNKGRRFYHAVRTVMSPEYRSQFLAPFLCRMHPEATSITIKTVEKLPPTIERARIEQENFEKMNQNLEVPAQEYGCHNDEEEDFATDES